MSRGFYIWLTLLLVVLFTLVYDFDRTSKRQFVLECQLEKPREQCHADWEKRFPGSMVN
jgi:hypothetical protein